MRGTDQLQCWINDCGNDATEFGEFTFALNEVNKKFPNLCECHTKGEHTWKRAHACEECTMDDRIICEVCDKTYKI